MQILAHRGYWLALDERNTLEAFRRAFENGFGIETDVRDYNGELVISHNIADEHSVKVDEMFQLYKKNEEDVPLALNVKADGIQTLLMSKLKKYDISNYFMFDMSIPEQVVYVREGFHTFARQSEFEMQVSMYTQVEGVWMDEFSEEWIQPEIIEQHLKNQKKVGIISSEIHQKKPERLWNNIKKYKDFSDLMLCTDVPRKAKDFFYEEN